MRSSYTNKKGEIITVSKEHLDTAVEIKLLLQKDSPSNRCSWAKHKQLMMKEGFHDSENSENYRKLVADYQKSLGKLPSAETYSDKVVTSKLESYKELVGEIRWEKIENQKYLRKINRGKKEITERALFIEEIKSEIYNVLSQVKWEEIMNHVFTPIKDHGKTRMILLFTDWHIGALVDVEDNKYNYDIAKDRIQQAVDQALQYAYDNKVYRIDVVFMGDAVEHAYMRDAQAYTAEFPVSKQMTLAGRLMIDALYQLSRKHFVTYRAFAGNHDRFNKDKNGNIDGDNAVVVMNEMVQLFIEQAKIENLMYVECHNYHARLVNVNGKNFKFVHGDFEKKNDTGKLASHSLNDKIHYDAIIYGHFHHFKVVEVGLDKLEISVGSTKGSDDYSEKLGVGSAPSQAIILVKENGDIDVKRLRLY
jgi:predicted phosphodiesterase